MLLEANGLRRSFARTTVFSDLGLALARGERLAVLGPSGSGKTLLLRTLAWLDAADAGEVRLDGSTPQEHGVPHWRRLVTYVAQQAPPLRGTPAEYAHAMASLKSQRSGPAEDPIELARGWGLPPESWSRPWGSLSGGERQRAYLAVAVSRRPAVLLLDEPTSALDADAIAAVEHTLHARSCIWVTHDRDQARRVASTWLELPR